MSGSRQAHRADAVRSGSFFSVSTAIKATAVIVTAIVLSLSAVTGTYAFLSSSKAVAVSPLTSGTSATISAGTAGITVDSTAISLTGLYPGDVRRTNVTVTASSSSTTSLSQILAVTAPTGVTAANGLTATVAPGTCASNGTAVTTGALGVTLAAGASTTVCVAVGMSLDAPSAAQGLSSTVTVNLTGTQS